MKDSPAARDDRMRFAMTQSRSSLVCILCLLACLLASPAAADPIVIIGSDSATFHGDAGFATDLRDYLQGGSELPLLLLGDSPATSAFTAAVSGAGVVATSSLSSVALDPNRYSALLVLSKSEQGTGCCDSDDALVIGYQSAITEFIGGGGALGIQNYIGEATYDSLLGTTSGANSHVFGFLGSR
jgi:hypothetical protein